MATQLPGDTAPIPAPAQRNRATTGLALISIGLLVLIGHVLPAALAGLLFVPALGLIFLLWGFGARSVGLLIPGALLCGAGPGIFLIEQPLRDLGGDGRGGVFLLSFALGWGLITVLSALVSDRPHWWALIPGGLLAVIGASLLAGGLAPQVLAAIGGAWPIGLIVLGLYLLLARRGLRG